MNPLDVTIALTKEEVAVLDRAVKYDIGNTLRGQANVRRRLAAAVSYGREPDPVEVEKEEFLTAEPETLRELQTRLRACG